MRTIILAVLLLASFVSVAAAGIQPPSGFEGEAFRATFVLYGHKGKEKRTLCTVWNYKQIDGGYDLLSAGHCISQSGGMQTYGVSENLGGPETPVSIVKYEMDKDFDFAIFEMKTSKAYPVLELGTIEGVSIGDAIINPNFALGAAKQLSRGVVSSAATTEGFYSVPGEFLVQEFDTGGASGSPVISAQTHKVIGISVDNFREASDFSPSEPANIGSGVEPIDNFAAFLTHVQTPTVKKVFPIITAEEFDAKFGPKHPFKLTDHSVTPRFALGGHTFSIDTYGMGLFDKYYYKAKVYIDREGTGFKLVSTKNTHYSVSVELQA